MKPLCLYAFAFLATLGLRCATQSTAGTQLLPGYNNAFYPTVLEAAIGVGQPFLLQQKYLQTDSVTVSDTTLIYNNQVYTIYEKYENPGIGYYIDSSQYVAYDIGRFRYIWPARMPNALYNAATTTFHSTIDCVGYGTRLLSATGNSSPDSNAYLQLISTVRRQNVTPFAAPGWVASAYEFAVAFPTLTNTGTGWQYIAGNVEAQLIDSINHDSAGRKAHPGLGTYTGVAKDSFSKAIPGDILSFGYAPGDSSNGHFMVIQQRPYLLNADSLLTRYFPDQTAANINNLLAQYNIYAVPLFDCSGENVHFFDSRKQMSGIGHGTLLMLTDHSNDIPRGFIFSPPQKTTGPARPVTGELMGSHVVAISVGRYVP
jgi:hypothetical protein